MKNWIICKALTIGCLQKYDLEKLSLKVYNKKRTMENTNNGQKKNYRNYLRTAKIPRPCFDFPKIVKMIQKSKIKIAHFSLL